MHEFASALAKARRGNRRPSQSLGRATRQWCLLLPDQLTAEVGPLSRLEVGSLGVLFIESEEWLRRRPYHRQKLAHVLLHQRAFAIEQAQRGVTVRYVRSPDSYAATLRAILQGDALGQSTSGADPGAALNDAGVAEPIRGPLLMMVPAEREMRAELAELIAGGQVRLTPNETWLTEAADFAHAREPGPTQAGAAEAGPRFRMDRFYRAVRQRTGILMEGDRPVGGRYSFDGENRERWGGEPEAPRPPRFRRTPLRDEVEEEILTRFSRHPGKLDSGAIPVTASEVRRFWRWALQSCLPAFGPYEDAMSRVSRGLFHTRISPLMNLGRVLPRTVIEETLAAEIPLASKEGFVRQVLGWREFVRHVHEATEGFRDLPETPVAALPGDAGYARWRSGARGETPTTSPPAEPLDGAWSTSAPPRGVDGGAMPDALASSTPLPPAYWGRRSGMACLDRVVADVWAEGWSHHITRLMVLSNIATLLGVSPRELTDWFWVAYADAYDWVVEPNVLAMGTFAVGDLMTTKPYVAGAAYISSMSDFCEECAFDPATDCPVASLYWAFLGRQRDRLANNERLRLPLASEAKRSEVRRAHDQRVFVHVRDVLVRGERLTPQGLRAATDDATDAAIDRVPSDSLYS